MIVPTIEQDGKAGELDVDSLGRVFRKNTLARLPGSPVRNRIPLYHVREDYYEPQKLAFQIDTNRIVEVVVFVHYRFKPDMIPQMSKEGSTEVHIKKNLPWYFSYGKRIEKEQV